MAKQLRYIGEFASVAGVKWRVEILQESSSSFSVKTLIFPRDTPVSIEWSEVDKLEPVQTSAATLTVISDTDREFYDLYTTVAGSIRMDVYRANTLYWSGTLDTEIYEEPYCNEKGYDVTLTFSDFSILDRFKFAKSKEANLWTMQQLINLCMEQSQINYLAFSNFISTTIGGGGQLLQNVCLLDENFYDEDSEPMTLRDVLDGILRPFALRIIQKMGYVIIYDINGIYGTGTNKVRWCLSDSYLSVDTTYNNCELTFSPYMKTDLLSLNMDNKEVIGGDEYTYSVQTKENMDPGFKLRLSTQTTNHEWVIDTNANGWRYFSIIPYLSGDASAGIAAVAYWYNGGDVSLIHDMLKTPGGILKIKSQPFIGKNVSQQAYYLNLKVEMLIDCRYNPFEDGDYNYQNVQDDFEACCNTNYIPMRLILHGIDGSTWHYVNAVWNGGIIAAINMPGGIWESGAGGWNESYLCYYDANDRNQKSGFNGWATNKPITAMTGKKLNSIYKMYDEGEYILCPPVPGTLEVEISNALITSDVEHSDGHSKFKDHYDYFHWFLIKSVGIKLVDWIGEDADSEDVILKAWVDDTAKDDLTIDTVCGTMPSGAHPTARGQFFTSSGNVIESFTRGGVTDTVERLLLGTVYSQYKGRKKKLSGTTDILHEFRVWLDNNESGQFILSSEIQNLIEDESEIVMVEISPDNYTGVEYINS